jgi:hypothetical protein
MTQTCFFPGLRDMRAITPKQKAAPACWTAFSSALGAERDHLGHTRTVLPGIRTKRNRGP